MRLRDGDRIASSADPDLTASKEQFFLGCFIRSDLSIPIIELLIYTNEHYVVVYYK